MLDALPNYMNHYSYYCYRSRSFCRTDRRYLHISVVIVIKLLALLLLLLLLAGTGESFRSSLSTGIRPSFEMIIARGRNMMIQLSPSNFCWSRNMNLASSSAIITPTITFDKKAATVAGSILTKTTTMRFLGSKCGILGNPLGTIYFYNDQTALKEIDENAIHTTIRRIMELVGYDTYDVTLLLVGDKEMRETNLESRSVDAPTDILSFPFHLPKAQDQPGVLAEPEFDVPDYYTLGDMVVCVPYVIRRCQEDMQQQQRLMHTKFNDNENNNDDDISSSSTADDDNDRGVSGAMADVNDPEKRIRMLLVHGILHLVGYDHIEDDDYEKMVVKEEQILKDLEDII